MLELAVGYVIGMATILIAVRHTNLKLRYQKTRADGELYYYQSQAHKLELDRAYQNGKAEQNDLLLTEMQRLHGEIDGLKRENENLRDKLDAGSIFAHTMTTKGNAVIRLQGDGAAK